MSLFDDLDSTPKGTGLFDDLVSNPTQTPQNTAGKGIAGQAKDLGLSALKSAIALPETVVGLADIPTLGRVGQFLENEGGLIGFRPQQAKEMLSDLHTDQYKAQQQELAQAEGVVDKAKVALTNPSLVANTIVESAAPMVGGAGLARGLLAKTGLGKMGVTGGAIAGGIGEGAAMSGMAASEIRSETEDGLLTPKQAGIALSTGVIGGLISIGGNRLAQRLKIGDVDTMLAKGSLTDVADEIARTPAKSIPRQIIEGAIVEGVFEELPQSVTEQILQNIALDREWSEGVDDAIVMGTLAGAVMGAGASGTTAVSRAMAPESPLITPESNGIDADLVQPTPSESNPAPMPVQRPDPSNGVISRAASQMPSAQTATDLGVTFPEARDFSAYSSVDNSNVGQVGYSQEMGLQANQLEKSGDVDNATRLRAAQNLYRQVSLLREQGNEQAAGAAAQKANTIYQKVMEAHPELAPQLQQEQQAAESNNLPILYEPPTEKAQQQQISAVESATQSALSNKALRKAPREGTFNIGTVNTPAEFNAKWSEVASSLPNGTMIGDAQSGNFWQVSNADDSLKLINLETNESTSLTEQDGKWSIEGARPPYEFSIIAGDPAESVRKPVQVSPAGLADQEQQEPPAETIKLNSKGQPFATEEAAMKSQPYKRNEAFATIVPEGDGFAVRIDEKAKADAREVRKQEASQKAKQRYHRDPDPAKDDLLAAISQLDGLNLDDAVAEGIDPEVAGKIKSNLRNVFTNASEESMDGMAERLKQFGYLTSDNPKRELLDKLMETVNTGRKVYAADSPAQIAQLEAEAEAKTLREMEAAAANSDTEAMAEAFGYEVPNDGNFNQNWLDTAVADALVQGVPESQVKSILMNSGDVLDVVLNLQRAKQSNDDRTGSPSNNRQSQEADPLAFGQEETLESRSEPGGETLLAEQAESTSEEQVLTTYTEQELAERERVAKEDAKRKAEADAKAKADEEVDTFNLTGSDRTADVASAAGQNDMFGASRSGINEPGSFRSESDSYGAVSNQPLYSGYERETGSLQIRQPGHPDFTEQGTLDLFAATEVPAATTAQQSRDNFSIRYKQSATGKVRSALDRVITPSDVAHVLAPFRKHGQETMVALVTDAHGNIVNLIRHTKGGKAASSVYPAELIAAIASTENAANVWFGHNHPSGVLEPSSADFRITDVLLAVLDGTDISFKGHVIVAPGGKKATVFTDESDARQVPVRAGARKRDIEITERVLRKRDMRDQPVISSADSAREIVHKIASENALILLTHRHQLIGAISMSPEEMQAIRANGQVNRIFRALDETNASAVIIKADDKASATNMAHFINNMRDIRVLDWFRPSESGSYISDVSRGGSTNDSRGAFFSRGQFEGSNSALSRDQVEAIASRITADWSNAPEMVTVASDLNLPADLQSAIEAQNARGKIDGVFHKDKFYLVADKIRTEADVERIVLHEALGHYGLRQLYGPALGMHMDRLFNRVGGYEGIQRLGKKYGFDLSSYWESSGDMSIAQRREMMADEMVAHIAGTGTIQPDLIQRIAHLIREGLRKIMAGTRFAERLDQMTDVEVLRIVAAARQAVTKGESRITMLTHDPRFVREFEKVVYGEKSLADDARFSRTDKTAIGYEQRIDDLFAGAPSNRKGVKVLDRADVLDLLGHGDKPLHLAESAVRKKENGTVKHKMTAADWKRVPSWIENPVAVFRSQTSPNRLVLFAPDLVDGRPVRVILQPNSTLGQMDVHLTINAYEEGGQHITPVDKWVKNGDLLYLDQEKSPAFSERSGLRLPKDVRQLRGYPRIVVTESELVKYRQENPDTRFSRVPDDIFTDAEAKRIARTFNEAREAVKAFQGKELVNDETQMSAVVSRNTLDKMLSRKAVTKSETAADHSLAVANADDLFKRATLGWSKQDRDGEPSIKAIHRYFAPIVNDGRASIVKLTVKETARTGQGNPLYSLEAVELNERSPAASWVETVASADGVDLDSIRSAGDVYSLANAIEEFNNGKRYYDHSIERKKEEGALTGKSNVPRALSTEANDTASNLSIASESESSTVAVPLSNEDLRAGIRAILPDFKDGDNRATIVNSFSGLPDVVKQEAKNQGSNGDDVQGVFHNGTIYIVADKITSLARLETLLFHEGTHGGVNALYADEGVSRAMNRLYAAMGGSTGFNKVVDQLEIRNKIEPYIKGTLQREADGRVAMPRELRNTILMQEVLAYTGEKGSKSFQLRLRELVGAVRNWLREHGFLNLAELGVTDIAYIAKQAREQGLKQSSDGGVTLFRFGDSVRNAFRNRDTRTADTVAGRAYLTLGNKDAKASSKMKRFFKRNFTAAGLLPDSVFKQKIIKDSQVNAHEMDTAHYIGALDRAISKAYGKSYANLTDAQRESLDNQMKSTEPDMSIPEDVRAALLDMRRSIAVLSGQYVDILQQQVNELQVDGNNADAIEKAALIETIISNMDTYAHRSYRAFDDPEWARKVTEETWTDAINYLKQQFTVQGMDNAEAENNAIRVGRTILEEGTAYESMSSFIKESKLGSKDLSTLKRRKDIAPEIRALLGEYKDVKINYAKTLAKMSRLVANTKFLEKIKEIGLQEGWLFTQENKPLDQSVTKIAGDQSEVYAPLNGYYVPNDINQAFIDALGQEQMADWLRTIIRANGMVKYGKTVLSPTTAFRNWLSAAFFAVANGHFDFTQMKKSVSGLREYFGSGSSGRQLAYLRELKELGVIYDTAYAGEMMDLLKDSQLENTLFQKGPFKSLRAANDFAQKFYQYGDDFWKIMGFENEKAMLMKHKGMSEADAKVEAAERIRNTYPTYSMTGRAVNMLRRFPLAGTFVSFPAEIIRTQFHMLRYLKQDWKESKPYATRKIMGLAAVSSLAYAAQALSKDLFDIGDDEEEAVRLMSASWNQNSNLWFMGRDEKGNLRYLDFSFLDPYNYFKRPINAIMRDQPLDKAVIQSAGEMLSPFFGEDIAFGAIAEVWQNQKDSGARVYNPQDMPLDQAQSIANHLRRALQPGFVNNIERSIMAAKGEVSASGKRYTAEEEIAAFFGFRASTFDPKTALYYNSFEFKDRKSDATGVLMQVAKDPNNVSDRELLRAYDTANRARTKAYTDMARLITASRNAGMTNSQIRQSLERSGISKADIQALLQGRIPRWLPDQRMMRNTIRKAEMLYGPEVVREMRERERTIIQRSRE